MKPHERRAIINTCRSLSNDARIASGQIDDLIKEAQRHKHVYKLIQNNLEHIAENLEDEETNEETAN